MKLAIFSDSHGSTQKMFDAITELRPDAVVHLGDGAGRALLKERFPDLPVHAVRGNCDACPSRPRRSSSRSAACAFSSRTATSTASSPRARSCSRRRRAAARR